MDKAGMVPAEMEEEEEEEGRSSQMKTAISVLPGSPSMADDSAGADDEKGGGGDGASLHGFSSDSLPRGGLELHWRAEEEEGQDRVWIYAGELNRGPKPR